MGQIRKSVKHQKRRKKSHREVKPVSRSFFNHMFKNTGERKTVLATRGSDSTSHVTATLSLKGEM